MVPSLVSIIPAFEKFSYFVFTVSHLSGLLSNCVGIFSNAFGFFDITTEIRRQIYCQLFISQVDGGMRPGII